MIPGQIISGTVCYFRRDNINGFCSNLLYPFKRSSARLTEEETAKAIDNCLDEINYLSFLYAMLRDTQKEVQDK